MYCEDTSMWSSGTENVSYDILKQILKLHTGQFASKKSWLLNLLELKFCYWHTFANM